MKSVARNKFLLCFRPVVLEVDLESTGRGGGGGVNCSRKKVSTYNITVEKQEDMKKISTTNSNLLEKDCRNISQDSVRRPCAKKTFSKIFKAALFQSSLRKRVRDRKFIGDSFMEKKSMDSNSVSEEIEPISILSSSSPFSSCSTESNTTTTSPSRIKKIGQEKIRNGDCSSNFQNGLFLLLAVSLLLTIIWGKICAVLITSIWLYFCPRRYGQLGWSKLKNLDRGMESTDYNKKETHNGRIA